MSSWVLKHEDRQTVREIWTFPIKLWSCRNVIWRLRRVLRVSELMWQTNARSRLLASSTWNVSFGIDGTGTGRSTFFHSQSMLIISYFCNNCLFCMVFNLIYLHFLLLGTFRVNPFQISPSGSSKLSLFWQPLLNFFLLRDEYSCLASVAILQSLRMRCSRNGIVGLTYRRVTSTSHMLHCVLTSLGTQAGKRLESLHRGDTIVWNVVFLRNEKLGWNPEEDSTPRLFTFMPHLSYFFVITIVLPSVIFIWYNLNFELFSINIFI